jgi:hypothetical protein
MHIFSIHFRSSEVFASSLLSFEWGKNTFNAHRIYAILGVARACFRLLQLPRNKLFKNGKKASKTSWLGKGAFC